MIQIIKDDAIQIAAIKEAFINQARGDDDDVIQSLELILDIIPAKKEYIPENCINEAFVKASQMSSTPQLCTVVQEFLLESVRHERRLELVTLVETRQKRPVTRYIRTLELQEKLLSRVDSKPSTVVPEMEKFESLNLRMGDSKSLSGMSDLSVIHPVFRVVIVCAKYEEAREFREVLKHGGAIENEDTVGSLLYHILTHKDKNDRPFEIRVYSPRNKAGSVTMGIDAIQILKGLSPDWVFMTGVCAGNSTKTVLGDVIIAEKVVDSRYGKQEINNIHHDIRMLMIDEFLNAAISETKSQLKGQWHQYVKVPKPISDRYKKQVIRKTLYQHRKDTQDSDASEHQNLTPQTYGVYLTDIAAQLPDQESEKKETCQRLLSRLQNLGEISYFVETDQYYLNDAQFQQVERLLRNTTFPKLDNSEPNVYCGTVMTDVSAVRGDIDEKKWIQYANELGARDLYGLDMEGIGLYQAINTLNADHRRNRMKVLMVKGVSDLADADKDYQFHTYGKQVSAAFVCEFLRCYGFRLLGRDIKMTSNLVETATREPDEKKVQATRKRKTSESQDLEPSSRSRSHITPTLLILDGTYLDYTSVYDYFKDETRFYGNGTPRSKAFYSENFRIRVINAISLVDPYYVYPISCKKLELGIREYLQEEKLQLSGILIVAGSWHTNEVGYIELAQKLIPDWQQRLILGAKDHQEKQMLKKKYPQMQCLDLESHGAKYGFDRSSMRGRLGFPVN